MELQLPEVKAFPYEEGDVIVRGEGSHAEFLLLHSVSTSSGKYYMATFLDGREAIGFDDDGELRFDSMSSLIDIIEKYHTITRHISKHEAYLAAVPY